MADGYSNSGQQSKYKSGFGGGQSFRNPKGSADMTIVEFENDSYEQTVMPKTEPLPVLDTWVNRRRPGSK